MARERLKDKEVPKVAEKILNTHKAQKIDVKKNGTETFRGETTLYRPDGKKFKVMDLRGKKLKADHLLYKRGMKFEVKAGTLWEEIPAMLKTEINWKENWFE